MSEYPADVSLTPSERARLDPRVNIERLETLLRRTSPATRELVLNSCYLDPEPDSPTVIGAVDPEISRLWHQVWGVADTELEAPPA